MPTTEPGGIVDYRIGRTTVDLPLARAVAAFERLSAVPVARCHRLPQRSVDANRAKATR